jgi:hypothetical protein
MSMFDASPRFGQTGAMAWGMQGRAAGDARRLALALLLMFALLMRGSIPAGWMPDLDGRTAGGLVICTGHGEAVLHGKSGPAAPLRSQHHDVCAFSGLGSAPTAHASPLPPATAFERMLAAAPAPSGLRASPPRHREQAARAPPQLI